MSQIEDFLQKNLDWLLSSGVKIVLILIGAFVVNQILKATLEKVINKHIKSRIREGNQKRAETLIGVFGGTLNFLILIIAILMVLPEFRINIAPILGGLGLAGLAVGMAARDIISDFISGIFILLENQYNVGDEVKIAGFEGKVKEITLRRTIIQAGDGTINLIPNSQVKIVTRK
jgi:small conductance mechanosensitive channel